MKESPIIIALDVESADEARDLVRGVGDACTFYKVGLELYAAAGMQVVDELIADGKQIFLDLKFYDIGETVRRAVAQVSNRGIRFLTVHGIAPVVRAAVSGRVDSKLKLLAVTVLTNFDESDLRGDGYACSIQELIALRVRRSMEAGVDGFICSPLEVGQVRVLAGPQAILVTPGVRSAGAEAGDQKRVASPRQAINSGANYVVIGRQVTRAADPRAEVERILHELES